MHCSFVLHGKLRWPWDRGQSSSLSLDFCLTLNFLYLPFYLFTPLHSLSLDYCLPLHSFSMIRRVRDEHKGMCEVLKDFRHRSIIALPELESLSGTSHAFRDRLLPYLTRAEESQRCRLINHIYEFRTTGAEKRLDAALGSWVARGLALIAEAIPELRGATSDDLRWHRAASTETWSSSVLAATSAADVRPLPTDFLGSLEEAQRQYREAQANGGAVVGRLRGHAYYRTTPTADGFKIEARTIKARRVWYVVRLVEPAFTKIVFRFEQGHETTWFLPSQSQSLQPWDSVVHEHLYSNEFGYIRRLLGPPKTWVEVPNRMTLVTASRFPAFIAPGAQVLDANTRCSIAHSAAMSVRVYITYMLFYKTNLERCHVLMFEFDDHRPHTVHRFTPENGRGRDWINVMATYYDTVTWLKLPEGLPLEMASDPPRA